MKKNFSAYLFLALLAVLFGVVCIIVIITRGNSKFIGYKLKIGAIIISLNLLFLTGCDVTATCYAQVNESTVYINDKYDDIKINLNNELTLSCSMYDIDHDISAVSYQLQDKDGAMIQSGNLLADDGAFDSSKERFKVILDPALFICGTDSYTITFYDELFENKASARSFVKKLEITK